MERKRCCKHALESRDTSLPLALGLNLFDELSLRPQSRALLIPTLVTSHQCAAPNWKEIRPKHPAPVGD